MYQKNPRTHKNKKRHTPPPPNPKSPPPKNEEFYGHGGFPEERRHFFQVSELFSPLQGPESHRGGNPQKMGKNHKIPLPGPTPENAENCPQKGEKLLRKYNFCNFSVIFPHFRGSDRGGEFCNFSPFFGDFRPGGFPGPVRGKTTRNSRCP